MRQVGQRNSSVKNKSNGCKGGKVEVLVHNNSRSLNSTTETTHSSNLQKLSTNKEESSIAPASEERSTFVVKLKKTDSGSLGLSIVGGRSSRLGDIGVFIKSTIDNTPAASNGQLKPWDQILKVNNVELDGRTLEEALMIIKEQSTDITLTILPSEQATAHLEASLSIKAGQMDDNKLKTECSSLREEEITSADSGTMKGSTPPPQENHQYPRSTGKPSAKLPDNGTDLATELLGDGGFMPASLASGTSQHRKTVVSSSGLTDSESSLSPVPENTFNARDDDVFFSMSPQSYSNSRGDTADDIIHTDDVMLNGEDFIYEENHGYQGGIETDAINVDLDIVVK
ncbi:pro-interleukin-16-like [Bolinopsis microptera]|uniref:pro-interleukin-16-like n=1 Tax=Bolinopsis microptera TaxID=2820187 RepID=UPI00307A6EA8